MRPPRKRVIAACVGLAAAVLLSLPIGPIAASLPSIARVSVPRGPTPTAGLSFARPSLEQLRASPRKVFAHYLPSLTVSIDNDPPDDDYYARNYLQPDGEKGVHSAYGGFLRDRPLPRPPLPGDWQLTDMEDEVRQAISMGIDGFSVDLLLLPGSTGDQRVARNVTVLMAAAHAVDPGFSIMLEPDLSGSLRHLSASDLADYVASLADLPAAYHLADGRLVVSPFHAESHDARWWRTFLSDMQVDHGITVAFLPVFLDERKYVQSFAPISYGLSNWGNRDPAEDDPASTLPQSPRGRIGTAHDSRLTWMQPVSMQDERPRAGTYSESEATTNLRDTWQLAIQGHADLVQLVTWNDYAEGTAMAPSVHHGWSPLELTEYYLTWYKTGRRPAILRDALFLTHRTQLVAAHPVWPETNLMVLQGKSASVDQIEVVAELAAPAVVVITVAGSKTTCDLQAGVGTCTAPLLPGRVRAYLERGDDVLSEVASPYPVTAKPFVQDLQYVMVSSLGPRARVPAVHLPLTALPGPVAPSPNG